MLFEKISTLCEKRNITIAKLERECAMGNGTVRGWKNSSPSIGNLKKVADYFKVPMEQLLESTEDETQNSVQSAVHLLLIHAQSLSKLSPVPA